MLLNIIFINTVNFNVYINYTFNMLLNIHSYICSEVIGPKTNLRFN